MIAAILRPRRSHTTSVNANATLEHILGTVKRARTIKFGRLIRFLLYHIAYSYDFGVFIVGVTACVRIADAPHADYAYLNHLNPPLHVIIFFCLA
jgi:hypothetical protein